MPSPRARGTPILGILLVLATLVAGGYWLWTALPATSESMEELDQASLSLTTAELPSGLSPAPLTGIRVAVVSDPRNERVTPAGFYANETSAWQTWLGKLGAELVAPETAELIILPHLICLDPRMGALVQRHLRAGGGLITTGALGARDHDCAPASDTLLVNLLGAGPGSIAPLWSEAGAGAHYAVVLGETALGADSPPGARIELRPADQIVFRGGDRELYYSDFLRNPIGHDSITYFDGAVVRSRIDAGRLVAFGFALTQLVPGWSEEVARMVVANAVTWAAGRPVTQLAPWPAGAEAAVVLALDIESAAPNAGWARGLLERSGLRGSFYVDGDLAEHERALVRAIARSGEIGIRSGARHADLDDETHSGSERLATARKRLEAVSNQPIVGLRPPAERLDPALLSDWRAAGGEYIFGTNNARAVAPELIPTGTDSVVLLYRTTANDFYLVNREGIRDRAELTTYFLDELAKVLALRGLYLFNYRSDIMANRDLRPALSTFVEAVRSDPRIWVAGADELSRWWRGRALVEHRVSNDGAEIRLSNHGPTALENAMLLVDLPSGTRRKIPLPRLEPGATVLVEP
jgi:hypothetical protein